MTDNKGLGPEAALQGPVAGVEGEATHRGDSPDYNNGLRHYPRGCVTGDTEIVDRQFGFVRCVLSYDYRFTSNGQMHREATLICQALEGPMSALGVWRAAPSPPPGIPKTLPDQEGGQA